MASTSIRLRKPLVVTILLGLRSLRDTHPPSQARATKVRTPSRFSKGGDEGGYVKVFSQVAKRYRMKGGRFQGKYAERVVRRGK